MSPRSVGAWRLAVMCLAGGEAERSICGSDGGDQIDATMAQDYLAEENIDVLLERARQAARRLVILMRLEIVLVARALLARGTLSGAQVNKLLASAQSNAMSNVRLRMRPVVAAFGV